MSQDERDDDDWAYGYGQVQGGGSGYDPMQWQPETGEEASASPVAAPESQASGFSSGRGEDSTATFSVDSQGLQALTGSEPFTDDSQQTTASALRREMSPVGRGEAARSKLFDWSTQAAYDYLTNVLQAPSRSHREGYCILSDMKPSKAGGYIQISFEGANKLMELQHFLLYFQGEDIDVANALGREQNPPATYHASHRCNNRTCTVPEHVCIESAQLNNARKGCLVWFKCTGHAGCDKWFLVCPHDPVCIKPIPGLEAESMEEALSRYGHPTDEDLALASSEHDG